MNHAFQTILWMLVQFFAPRHNAQIRFLKAQVAILRKRIPKDRIVPSPAEKSELLRLGAEVGHDVRPVLEIVTPATYRRWANQARRGRRFRKSGRPPLTREIKNLVIRMGRENLLWGYRRIVGEMKKLGHCICATSVKRILADEGIHPTPEKNQHRQPATPWAQFVAAHMESLVATDFFTKTVYTWRGRFDAYVLVWIHLASRKVFCSPATFNPDEAWVMQQARNAAMWMQDEGIKPRWILMDHDTKFSRKFRHFWHGMDVETIRIPVGAPQANAFVESFVGKCKHECLNHFVILSLRQLDYVMDCWISHYLTQRPHRSLSNRVLDPNFRPQLHGTVCCRQRLGGLIKSYCRAAA
jgi:putative transposase